MKLTSIEEIKDGLTVFMPSGIQADIFNEGNDIIVKYANFTEDRYSHEDFNKLIQEGIEVFNDVTTVQQSVLIESLIKKGYIRKSLAEDYFADEETEDDLSDETDNENKKIELELELKDGKLEVEAEIDNQEFKGELINTLEDEALSESTDYVYELENLKTHHTIWSHTKTMKGYKWTGRQSKNDEDWNAKGNVPYNEADENGETTLKSFFGLDENDFKTKKELIKKIQDNTDYDVVATDNLSITVKDRTADNSEDIIITLTHPLKEAYEQKDCPKGTVYKGLKAKKKEYLTADFKLNLLQKLDRIAREYPDIHVRQQATTFMDEMGLQEYYDTKKIVDFVKKYTKVLKSDIDESFKPVKINEMIIDCILDRKNDNTVWTDNGAVPYTPEDFYRTIMDYGEEGYDITRAMDNGTEEDVKAALKKYIDDNKYDETIKDYIDSVEWLNESVNKRINESVMNISNDLTLGHKTGTDTEYGNWICTTSLDEKWEAISDNLKLFILASIAVHVRQNEMELDDLELEINSTVCINNEISEDDLETLELFNEDEIVDVIKGDTELSILFSYKIEFDGKHEDVKMKKSNKKSLKENKKFPKRTFKEEDGEYKDLLDDAANDLEDGWQWQRDPITSGTGKADYQDYKWGEVTLNGEPIKDCIKTVEIQRWLLNEISYPVRAGHDSYSDLDLIFTIEPEYLADDYEHRYINLNNPDVIADLIKIGFDEDAIKEGIKNAQDRPEIECWAAYDINYEEIEKEEWVIVNKNGEHEEYFDTKEDAEYELENNYDQDDENAPYTIKSTLEEGFKLKDKKKKKKKLDDSYKKRNNRMTKVNEDAYKVYSSIDGTDCGVFNSWNDVETFLNDEWGKYSASMIKENPNFGTEQDKDNFYGNYEFDILPAENMIIDVCPDCGNDVCTCDKNADIADAQTSDYVQVDGVTVDPKKVDNIEDTLVFTPKETEVMNNLETGEKILLPNEQPDNADNYKNVGGATEIIKADINDISGTTDDIISDTNNDIDDFIAGLVADEDDVVSTVCPECGEEICVCEKNECMQKLPNPKENKTQADLKKEKPKKEIKEGLDAFDDEDLEYEFRTVRKNALANPNAYEGRYTQADIKQARKQYADDIAAKKALEQNEEFKDTMGMLTDINDTDFPDALAAAVDTKEDGNLYRISDIAKEIEELKASLKSEIENIKNDLKTSLTDIKNDIKLDVKDIQTDVTSKLDNTNSKIADLTSEEDMDLDADIEDEELDLENEESDISTDDAEADAAVEEEKAKQEALSEIELKRNVMEYIRNNGAIYEQIKNVIRGSKLSGKRMSLSTLAEKLREDYGINTRVDGIMENVALICEYTPIKKYIIDEKVEKSELKKLSLGEASRFIRTGMDKLWENQREQEKYSNLQSILTAQNETVEQAKKAIDKLANQEGNAQKIKKAIELTTDNDQEKEQAIDYAVDKIDEKALTPEEIMRKALRTNGNGILGGLAYNQFDPIAFKSVPKRK